MKTTHWTGWRHYLSFLVLLALGALVPAALSAPAAGTAATAPMAVKLRCEYSAAPIGSGEREPRLSWQLDDPRPGARQTAYRLQVAKTRDALADGTGLVWDSGEVKGDQSVFVRYAGPALESRQRYWWRVRVWDHEHQATPWSEPAFWEMGLLEPADWTAKWIETALVGGARTPAPAPYLRREFQAGSDLVQARLYVTALGLYECQINGQRVGDGVFRPGWTVYPRRVQYDTYDVTALLRGGANVVGAILGDGWYVGHIANRDRQTYGDRPRFKAQLELTFRSGRRQQIVSDTSWRWSSGPILEGDLIMGAAYDARLELHGWAEPGFDDRAWQPAREARVPAIALVAPVNPPVRAVLEMKPVADPKRMGEGRYLYDLGQNFSGWVRLRGVVGPSGKTIRIRYAEMLQPNGELYTENLRTARATDYYTLGGGETAAGTWEPRFTFHGFRYVEVSGLPAETKPTRDLVTGIVVHSDTPVTGRFECSDPLLNRLQSNITWGQRSNFLEVPTDCPQRDERLGWTGDAQIFVRTATFNMNVAGFFAKWQEDFADSQAEDGSVPPTVPDPRPNFSRHPGDAGPAWSDAIVICPWTIYRAYGDRRILERHYGEMTRWIEHLEGKSTDYIRSHILKTAWGGYGDWVAMDALIGNDQSPTPKDLIGTAYFARVVGIMADTARVLNKPADVERWTKLQGNIVAAFNREFVSPGGRVQGGNQTSYLLALAYDLLPQEKRANAVEHLRKTFEQRRWHLSTGFVGTPLICPTLTRYGTAEDAYRVLQQKTYPGWLYSVLQGATTIWERWNSYSQETGFGPVSMNSFNHYAYGAVGEWMYGTIAGIDLDPDPLVPAYKRSVVRPRPGGGLTWARGSLDTAYGELATSWKLEGKKFTLELRVPANAEARVILPIAADTQVEWSGDGQPRQVAQGDGIIVPAGTHRFVATLR